MVASLDQAANISLRELSNAPIFSHLRPNCEVKSALKLMPMNFFCVTALMLLTGCAHSLATKSNNLTYAVAWKKTSAEYEALFHQGFNVARQRVETALRVSGPSMPRLAVISDVDDTLLLSTVIGLTLSLPTRNSSRTGRGTSGSRQTMRKRVRAQLNS